MIFFVVLLTNSSVSSNELDTDLYASFLKKTPSSSTLISLVILQADDFCTNDVVVYT